MEAIKFHHRENWYGDTSTAFVAGLKLIVQDMDGDGYSWAVHDAVKSKYLVGDDVLLLPGWTYEDGYNAAVAAVKEAATKVLQERLETVRSRKRVVDTSIRS